MWRRWCQWWSTATWLSWTSYHQIADRVRDTGVLVLRQVVEEEQALQWKAEVRQYIADNPGVIGFPEDNPQVLSEASPVQLCC